MDWAAIWQAHSTTPQGVDVLMLFGVLKSLPTTATVYLPDSAASESTLIQLCVACPLERFITHAFWIKIVFLELQSDLQQGIFPIQ